MISTRYRKMFGRFLRDERGQVLPVITVAMIAICGIGALSIDVGHATFTYRALQAATDATALAGAQAMPTATSVGQITGNGGVVQTYSSAPGGYNASTDFTTVTVTSQVLCLGTLLAEGIPCIGNVPDNAVQVTQTMTLNTYFAGILGKKTLQLTTTSTASIRGGAARPSNIAVVVDSTLSMNIYDSNCGATQMTCAMNGLQVLLKSLTPCPGYLTVCSITNGVSANSFDRVALFTFPNITVGTASIDTSCTTPVPVPTPQNGFTVDPTAGYIVMPNAPAPWGGIPTAVPYTFPSATASSYAPSGSGSGTYQVTPFVSDYRVSDTATTLNPNSSLVMAAGGRSGCGSMLPSNYDGVYGTYYAGAIYAAQASLIAEQKLFPTADNVIIILGDGDNNSPASNWGQTPIGSPATANGIYPSYVDECGQAITAAKAAYTAGTKVYTIAYGASPIGCTTDLTGGAYQGVNPCDTMSDMATAPQMFYSDYKQSGSLSVCQASQPVVSLNDIFTSIANDLTQARLIPNNTT